MNSSLFPKSTLFFLSVLVLMMALVVRTLRSQVVPAAPNAELMNLAQCQRTQRAVALLYQALLADNQLTYSAVSDTMATYGGKKIHSEARVTHAPPRVVVEYVSGDMQGVAAGFDQRSFWRKADMSKLDEPPKAYAEVQQEKTALAARRFAMILENYSAEWVGQETVAGRSAEVVMLRPFRPVDGAQGPAKRLWIDTENHLTLGIETLNHQMEPVMRSMFTKVDLDPTIPAGTFPPEPKERPVAQDMSEEAVEQDTGVQPPQLQPDSLPPGFKLEGVGVHRCRLPGQLGSHTLAMSRYTDGMNTLTVFAAKKPENPAPGADSSSEKAETCNFGSGMLVTRHTERGRVIAMADLPKPVLQRVVDSANVIWANSSQRVAPPEQK